jgi:adenosylcobinamide amidohydrolase
MHSTGPQQSTLLIVVGISTVLPASSTIVLVVASAVNVSVIVSVKVEVSVIVVVCVVVLVVVFVTVTISASLHPVREKSSEAEMTTVNIIALILVTLKIF